MRSHPLSDQLPGEHTGQGLLYLGFPVGAVNLFGMHIFHQSLSSARYSFTDPWRDGRLSQPASSGVQTTDIEQLLLQP